MDLSKLNSNERLAFWGAVLSIIGTILTMFGYAGGAGGLWLTFLLAIAMIVILFLPTWSPQTSLPGSKGTLMLIVGGIAAIGAVLGLFGLLALLGVLGAFAGFILLPLLGLVLGIVGGLMMGWGGWQEFQAEGGKFQLGGAATGGAAGGATTGTSATAADERTVESTQTTTTSTTAATPAAAPTESTDAEPPRSDSTYADPTRGESPSMSDPAADPDADRPYDREDRPTP